MTEQPFAHMLDYTTNQRSLPCQWPGCTLNVAPRFWGCKRHWFQLPKPLRDRLWNSYVSGQFIYKQASEDYLAAADDAHWWAVMREAGLH